MIECITEPGASTVKDPDNGLSTWYGGSKIAFSAFLSKRYDLLGKGQHVKFDKVLLNDGDGYEAVTGVFRLLHNDYLILCNLINLLEICLMKR
jgi:hypothetical protein